MATDITLKDFWGFPVIPFPSLIDDMDDSFSPSNFLSGLSVSEDGKNVYIEASIPGVTPKDVEVTFSKGLLTIKGEKKEQQVSKEYQKKATQTFLYRVAPTNVDPHDEPQASYKNGVMTVTFTKVPEEKPKKIAVKTA